MSSGRLGHPGSGRPEWYRFLIRQLSALDPDSYRFRYHRSKEGEPSLSAEVTEINLRHFAEAIERLADYLDRLDSAIAHLEELKADMESEWT